MKRTNVILVSFLFLVITSCRHTEDTDSVNPLQAQLVALSDTIPDNKVIAKYMENNSLMVLISCDSLSNTLVKIIYSNSSPVIADSLVRTGKNEYASKLYPATYRFADCEVFHTITMKGVHPSSNWQGQTPGQKAVTYTFRKINQ